MVSAFSVIMVSALGVISGFFDNGFFDSPFRSLRRVFRRDCRGLLRHKWGRHE